MKTPAPGQLIAFYATKNRIGNTMCLANIAVVLAKRGYRVLAVDCEFEEGPQLNFFSDFHDLGKIANLNGVADLIVSPSSSHWREHVLRITIPETPTPVDLITTGTKIALQSQKVGATYFQSNSPDVVARLRGEWTDNYDFVLLNSRKGVYDTAAATTLAFIPNVVLVHVSPEQTTIDDVRQVAMTARNIRGELSEESPRVFCVPIICRLDSRFEFQKYFVWLERLESALSSLYDDWLPPVIPRRQFIDGMRIPRCPYYEFGEPLAVIRESGRDLEGLAFAYENVAALIANGLSGSSTLFDDRDAFLEIVRKQNGESLITPYRAVTPQDVEKTLTLCGVTVSLPTRIFSHSIVFRGHVLSPARLP